MYVPCAYYYTFEKAEGPQLVSLDTHYKKLHLI